MERVPARKEDERIMRKTHSSGGRTVGAKDKTQRPERSESEKKKRADDVKKKQQKNQKEQRQKQGFGVSLPAGGNAADFEAFFRPQSSSSSTLPSSSANDNRELDDDEEMRQAEEEQNGSSSSSSSSSAMQEQEEEEEIEEVKKRDGVDTLVIDASYKNYKIVSRWKGEKVFGGLDTVVSKYGEERLSFNVFSDSHDQMQNNDAQVISDWGGHHGLQPSGSATQNEREAVSN